MANTYTCIYVHFVFAVKFREALIRPEWKDALHKYITGIVQGNGHKMMIVNSVADHLHMLVGFNTHQSLSELMRLVKGDSSEFVNKNRFTEKKFRWQEGYGAFSVDYHNFDIIVRYILNQEAHHKKKSLREEYVAILSQNKIDFKEEYLFLDISGSNDELIQ
ncbi:IS200/IS605 family transposase [Dyadobacter sp. CY347]|uniref:IS200/IS605 family transposase n=1 Tax=Dyadobacter sp. CY347 TaxID=2909336 RepID=UPI001F160A15|nr:IS200/IS605 family transposase [Dyadobacter sp. CY347]MCF2488763.1 IS200/IS605 family transposase [Dyadobacter sp. CY347]